MQMALYLVNAFLIDGESVRAVARDHGVSKTQLYELIARYEAEGEAGLIPRSKRPHHNPNQIVTYYNEVRPHRSLPRRSTPKKAFDARTKARPARSKLKVPPHYRVRQDKVNGGNVTLRYKSQLSHIGVGRRYSGRKVLILAKDRDVRIVTHDGELLRRLTLDPSRIYQPQGS